MDMFAGLSPLVSRELVHSAYLDRATRIFEMLQEDNCASFLNVLITHSEKIKRAEFEPFILIDSEGKPRDFTYMPIFQYGSALILKKAGRLFSTLGGFLYAPRQSRACEAARIRNT